MDWGTLNNIIQDVLWVIGGFIWTRKMLRDRRLENPLSLDFWTVGIILAVGLLISSVSLYFSYRPRIQIVTKTVTVTQPYEFAWNGGRAPTNQVIGRHFKREKVYLDDTAYLNCEFDEVTFIYNGTGPISLSDNKIGHFTISTDNPALRDFGGLLYALRALSIPLIDVNTGKPPMAIQPAMPQPSKQTK